MTAIVERRWNGRAWNVCGTCVQECTDELQQSLVLDSFSHLPHQFVVIDSMVGTPHVLMHTRTCAPRPQPWKTRSNIQSGIVLSLLEECHK
jgi:hypothetical protein